VEKKPLAGRAGLCYTVTEGEANPNILLHTDGVVLG
jgi:hypothetical protein